MSKVKVLIVEDQSVVSTNIEILLKHKGFKVLPVAATGEQALKIIEQESPDIVIMDIALPGQFDGIDTTEIIKEKWDIPVIYLTAKTDLDTITRAKVSEAYGYLTKDVALKDQLPILIDFVLYKHKLTKEKEAAEMELRDSEEKFRSIASSARDAIVFLDNKGSILFWNNAAEKIFHFSSHEALGKPLNKLIAPEYFNNYYERGFSDYGNDGKGDFIGRTIELDAVTKEKEVIPIELSLSSVKLKGQWCACGIIRDVTLRKATENELERLIEEIQISREVIEQHANDLISLNHKLAESEEQLTELNISKDKLFSIIAHDLKGPFQGLLGYSEILARDIETLGKEDIKEFAHDLYDSANHLFKLLENLLQWSRIQRGVIDYNPDDLLIKELLFLNKDLLNTNAKQKKISLVVDCQDNLIVFADANMVNTIVRNLIANAIKFTPIEGTITISAKEYDNEQIICSVADTGVGIDEEDLDKLFKIDVHHSTLGTNNEKGTGLGLILCKDLVEKNNGKIWAESEIDKGTTFYFTLVKSKSSLD